MGFKGGRRRSGKAFGQTMQARAKDVKAETNIVAKLALRSLEAEFRKRDLGAKRVNKQDSPSGKESRQPTRKNGRGQVRSTGSSSVVKLQVNAFWTGARSRAIKGILTYLGLIPMLFRTGLIVRDRLKKGTQGPVRVRRLSLKGHPRFAGWAARADKGSQYLRHVVYAKGEILNSLMMKPALKAVIPTIMNEWKQSTLTALRGYR